MTHSAIKIRDVGTQSNNQSDQNQLRALTIKNIHQEMTGGELLCHVLILQFMRIYARVIYSARMSSLQVLLLIWFITPNCKADIGKNILRSNTGTSPESDRRYKYASCGVHHQHRLNHFLRSTVSNKIMSRVRTFNFTSRNKLHSCTFQVPLRFFGT